jgi:hypothetical protein
MTKYLAIFLLFCSTALSGFSQDENGIKFGSEATLTFNKSESGIYTFKITEIKKFNKTVDLDDNDLLAAPVDTDQVKLYFCAGRYESGDDYTVLIIKSGLKIALKYVAKIKASESDAFESTVVSTLQPKVKSIEMWHFKLNAIQLSDFLKGELKAL